MTRLKVKDGSSWPEPFRTREVEWQLRYGEPSREDLLVAAGVLRAYYELTTREGFGEKLAMIRAALESGAPEHTDEPDEAGTLRLLRAHETLYESERVLLELYQSEGWAGPVVSVIDKGVEPVIQKVCPLASRIDVTLSALHEWSPRRETK